MTEWPEVETAHISKIYPGDYRSIWIASKAFNKNAHAHGFYDEPRSLDRAIMLAVTELAEAYEEIRDGHDPTEIYYNNDDPNKPEGFPVELADTIIRILDTAYEFGINIGDALRIKHEYNLTRPFKHGRQF